MNCASPVDAAILVDYWLEALSQLEEDAVESHLFACDECGARLRQTISLAEGIRDLVRQGALLTVVNGAFVDRLAEDGLRVRQYAPPNGGSVACTVTADDDFLIGHLTADLSQAKRVDLSFCDERHVERIRLADIPFHPAAGSVVFQQSITYAKAAASETTIARLVAVDEAGGERLLGEFTFHHTRTMSGPGAQ